MIPEPNNPVAAAPDRFCVGEWQVLPSENLVRLDGETVQLEPKVMALLVFLAHNAGTTISRERLFEAVWSGVVIADITVSPDPVPSLEIPDAFWLPDEMPQPWKDSWLRWLDSGSDYYATITRPYLETGRIDEYIPTYLR